MILGGVLVLGLTLTSSVKCTRASTSSSSNNYLMKHLFATPTEARCLDGTAGGVYYGSPASGDSNLWVIFLQGGGHCSTKSSCAQRATTNLGSSNDWPSYMTGNGCLSSDPLMNPDFNNAHHVFIPYCGGDWHSGTRTTATAETWGYYFSGHVVVQAAVKYLISELGIVENAQNVLVAGSSAGGIGLVVNIDYISDTLRLNGLDESVAIKGVPIAGWFMPGPANSSVENPPNDYPNYVAGTSGGWEHDASIPSLWGSYLPSRCVTALREQYGDSAPTWRCFSASNMYRYIDTRLFIMENVFDCDQITFEMEMPNNVYDSSTKGYVSYYGAAMRSSIVAQVQGKNELGTRNGSKLDGLFLASCYEHVHGIGIGWNESTTVVAGLNSSGMAGDWFWGRNQLAHVAVDKCSSDLPCNPTCGQFLGNGYCS